jgi:hypothetical protein
MASPKFDNAVAISSCKGVTEGVRRLSQFPIIKN